MELQLLPIKEQLEDNREYLEHPEYSETLKMSVAYFQKIGYKLPWIGYLVKWNDSIVGSCAFKGAPKDNKVEIAYGVFEPFRHKGIGTAVCHKLVEIAQNEDPDVIITARTLPEKNDSTSILQKNGFFLAGTIMDKEDGEVWEWIYQPVKKDMTWNYHGKMFQPVQNSENGETSPETIFLYQQDGNILYSEYSGGQIIKGHLIGLVDHRGCIDMRYHQINSKGELMTGICHSVPEWLPDGRIRLYETWQWTSGDYSQGNSIIEEIKNDSSNRFY